MSGLAQQIQAFWRVGTTQSGTAQRIPAGDSAPSKPAQRYATLRTLQRQTVSRWTMVLTLLLGDVLGLVLLCSGAYVTALAKVPGAVEQVYPVSIVLAPALFLVLGFSGFYHFRFTHPALEMRRLATVMGVIAGTAVLTIVLVTGNGNTALLVAVAGGVGTIALPLMRGLTRILFARWSWWGLPAVVVSSAENEDKILDTLNRWPEIGLRPVAVLSDPREAASTDSTLDHPGWAAYLARKFDTSYAIISAPDLSHARRARLLRQYTKHFDNVFFARDASGAPALWTAGASGEGLLGYEVRSGATSRRGAWLLKRVLDFVVAGIALFLLAPVFALIALLLRLDSPGPVFYRQERMGIGGQRFTVLKFRSMYCDAEDKLAQVLDRDPERREEYRTYHKLDDDPRVTPFGKFLRRYSLDELPQLVNVIRGEMSLVGPRPYMPSERPEMNGLKTVVLDTPPGVTGLWQVSGRNRLSFDERIDLDVHYVQNWSLWLDLYLLIRTIPTVLTGEGRETGEKKTEEASHRTGLRNPSTRPLQDLALNENQASRATNSTPLLTTTVSLPDRILWFGSAELYSTGLHISGWQWSGHYEQRISLSDLERVETRARAERPNMRVHTEDSVQPLHLETGMMLWHWKLKELGVEVVGRG
jgi:Undecaprenyl-phosphate galactose phosphotransferase WbaP